MHTAVYNRYVRWGEPDVWRGIFEALASEYEVMLVFIDSSIVKAHRAASGAKAESLARVLAVHATVAAVRFMPL